MNVTVTKNDIASGLAIVTKASPSSAAMTILTGVLLTTVDANTLRLTATDLHLGIEYHIPSVNSVSGSVVVPSRLLNELIRKLPSGDVLLEYSSAEAGLTVRLVSSPKSEFSIRTFDESEFPPFPEVEARCSIVIPNSGLRRLIKTTAFAASSEESRPFLTGVYTTVEDGFLKMVATDSWRLAYSQLQLTDFEGLSFEPAIIPAKALLEFARVLPDSEALTTLSISANQACFASEGLRMVSRLIEGQFPNYKAVIPKTHKTRVTVSRLGLLAAAERASLMVRDGVSLVRMTNADGVLMISSNSPDLGKGYEEIPVVSEGDETRVVLDSKYMIDVLRIMDSDTIDVLLQGSQQSICLTDGNSTDCLHLIMPVKVPA